MKACSNYASHKYKSRFIWGIEVMNESEPLNVNMSQWNIIVTQKGKTKIERFLGYCHEEDTCRISSQIKSYAPHNDTGQTLSGSRYLFIDKPGELHPEAQVIYDLLDAFNEIKVFLKYEDLNK